MISVTASASFRGKSYSVTMFFREHDDYRTVLTEQIKLKMQSSGAYGV